MYTPQQKIGILGSGHVGQTLGAAFLAEGNPVMLGTRNPSKPEVTKWQKENPSAKTGTFAGTAAFGDILVLCVEGGAAMAVLDSAGAKGLAGKVILDTTNPISGPPSKNGVLPCFTDLGNSLMERLQHAYPNAHFVKCFNSVGSMFMYKPSFPGGKPSMFICGDDAEARKTTASILDKFGWETADMGAAEAARAIEPLCILWCIPGLSSNQWSHAFKLLKA